MRSTTSTTRPPFPVTSAAGTWILAGTLHHDEVLEACGFEMPDGEFETLAGFLLDRLGHIPVEGETLTVDGWTFEIAKMDRHRIAAVQVVAPRPKPAVPSGGVTGGRLSRQRANHRNGSVSFLATQWRVLIGANVVAVGLLLPTDLAVHQ